MKRLLTATAFLMGTTGLAAAEGQLQLYNWGNYTSPELLAKFEKETGIKVNLKIHDGSDEEMVALVKTSAPETFDVMTPTSAFIPQAARDGILMELNDADFPLQDYFSVIANWAPTIVP